MKEETGGGKRDYKLDIVRVIACFMVILMHSPSPDSNLDGVSYHCLDMLSQPCIGLFFMVSGALLLPVRLSYFDFVKRRLAKVLWPTIFFSMLTLALALLYDEITWGFFVKSICSLPFATYKAGVLWFMYPLIGMYLLAPIISPYLEKAGKKEIQVILAFWLITLLWNPLQLVLNVDTSEENILHAFSGYTGYFLLGYYLKRFPIKRNLKVILPVLFIIPWCMDAANKIFNWGVSKYDYFWYLSIFCVMQCVAWLLLITECFSIEKLTDRTKKLLVSLSSCSFGIYLMHRIIMQRIIWNLDILHGLHPYLQILAVFTLTLFLSWSITRIISELPYSKYIVGFKNENSVAIS